MAEVLDISANVPEATINAFARSCIRYRDELGNSQSVAIRRGTIALVKGLRARTIRSKKQAPTNDVQRCEKPRYLTPKGKGQRAVPAWKVKRHGGSDTRYYTHAAESRAEARRRFGKYTRWGLAKHSWGWFMKTLFNRAELASGNPATKIDDRMAEGHLREVVTGSNPHIEVLIVNKLDYIRKALPPNALAEAMAAATRYINGQIDKGLATARKELK